MERELVVERGFVVVELCNKGTGLRVGTALNILRASMLGAEKLRSG